MSTAQTSHDELSISSHAGAEFFCQTLITLNPQWEHAERRILIAGCGAGHEAALIQRQLDASVDAVDVEDEFDNQFRAWPNINYQLASVCDLPFANDHFDAIFYHHVIEHVDQPQQSLTELARVLKPKGWIFVGTPNRHRLLSSVGAHQQTQWDPTWKNKFNDNVRDWKARLTGRFRNECGAHAGFSQFELAKMLSANFENQHWVTQDYLQHKYQQHRLAPILAVAAQPILRAIVPPSIYVFAQHP